MTSKVKAVALFEFKRAVKRWGFIASTLGLPILMAVLIAIQTLSAVQSEQTISSLANSYQKIVVIDNAKLLKQEALPAGAILYQEEVKSADLQRYTQQVQQAELDALLILPTDLATNRNYTLYARDPGLLGQAALSEQIHTWINESIKLQLRPAELLELLNSSFTSTNKYFSEEGQEVAYDLTDLALPIGGLIIFFMAVFIAAQYLLQSVAEEKENRVLESLQALITPYELITGKIIGFSLVVLTQLFIWLICVAAILVAASSLLTGVLGLLSLLNINIVDVIITLTFTVLGFLFFAGIMTGVGAVGSSYKDSQGLSSIFIITAMLPLYFIAILIAEPSGTIAQIFSYFPLTSSLILLMRYGLNALSTVELIGGILLNIIYVVISLWLAVRLFALGSLTGGRRLSWQEMRTLTKSLRPSKPKIRRKGNQAKSNK